MIGIKVRSAHARGWCVLQWPSVPQTEGICECSPVQNEAKVNEWNRSQPCGRTLLHGSLGTTLLWSGQGVNLLTTAIECMCGTYQVFESIYPNDPVTFYRCKFSYSERFFAEEFAGIIFRLKYGHFVDHSDSQTFYLSYTAGNQIHALLDRGQ